MKKLLSLLAFGALLSGCFQKHYPIEQRHFNDGDNILANELFSGADESLINTLAPDGHTPVSCNVFYLFDGATNKRILIDTGYGGALQSELEAANISPDTITDILITHVHFDHVGGLMATNGTAAFPNATVHITAAELDFWKNAEPPLANPELAAAVEKAYKISIIIPDGKTPVAVPWLFALDAAGHTPGHVVFGAAVFGNQFFMGDLLHSELIQFSHPEIYPVFDHDKEAAYTKRTNLLTRAANNGWFVHFSHVKEDSSRRVEKDGDGFKIIR